MSEGKNLQMFKTALMNECLLKCKPTHGCCCRHKFTPVDGKCTKSFDCCVLASKEPSNAQRSYLTVAQLKLVEV